MANLFKWFKSAAPKKSEEEYKTRQREEYQRKLPLAEQGDPDAQYDVGLYLLYGGGKRKTALQWFHKAAEQGNVRAQEHLGYIYADKIHASKKDKQKAVYWMRKAAEQEIDSEQDMGAYFSEKCAQERLAQFYETGFGVEKDYCEAVVWYRKAAEFSKESAKHLAFLYENGIGVEKNMQEAEYWHQKVEELGPDIDSGF